MFSRIAQDNFSHAEMIITRNQITEAKITLREISVEKMYTEKLAKMED